jgi:cytochrome b561
VIEVATFFLRQTLVFWSGWVAASSFVLLMLSCSCNLSFISKFFSEETKRKLSNMHKYFVWLAIITVAVHAVLAILSSMLGIWL